MTEINYLALATASFLFAITPGPGLVAVLAISVSRGMAMGASMTLGLVCADMIYLLVAIVSLAGIAQGLEGVMVVRLLGGMYIVWLGYRQMRSPPVKAERVAGGGRSLGLAWVSGFMISITNPKVVVFYLSFLPLFLDLGRLGSTQTAAVMAVMFTSVTAAPLLVAVMAGRAKDLIADEVSGRWVNRVTGALLIVVGIALVALV